MKRVCTYRQRILWGGRDDYRLRQDRFFSEVSSRYGMDRGEPREPAKTKKHTTKREWQIAKQEQELNILEDKKTILEFDIQSIQSMKNYEFKRAEQAKEQRQNIQDEITKLESANAELQQRNEELHNSRYEEFKKYKQGMELRQNLELEIKELSEKQNQLQEYVNQNAEIIRNWKSAVKSKINSLNKVVDEYSDFADEMEKQYSQEITDYILNALGDIPDDGPEMDFNTPTTAFGNYDGEEYDLEL